MDLGDEVLFDVSDGVAVITLNRPEKLNAFNDTILDGMNAAFDRIDRDRSIGAAVITGSGNRAFTAGIDMNMFTGGPEAARAFLVRQLTSLYDRAVRLRVPIIAAIEGHAPATGSEFTMCCNLAYAGQGAIFRFADLDIGLASAAGMWRVSEKLSRMRFTELTLTSRPFSAQEAYEIGLLTRVVPDGEALATSVDVAKTIAAKPMLALEVTKKALDHGYADDWLAFLELQEKALRSHDFEEGVAAFLEKRVPNFRGR